MSAAVLDDRVDDETSGVDSADNMPRRLDVFVPGRPAPQGSKRHVGGGRMVESSKAVGPWRTVVAWHVAQAFDSSPLVGAVSLHLEFVMPRPVGTPKKRTPMATKKPDVDKLTRAICDALTHVAWIDDSQVVDLRATKRIAEIAETPGCRIIVEEVLS